MKIKGQMKILLNCFTFDSKAALVVLSGFVLSILVMLVLSVPIYAASSSGNTTVYDYDTNETLTAGSLTIYKCNVTGLNATLTLDVDPYVGTDELELIKAYYRMVNGSPIEENITDLDFENRTRVVLDLNATHSYNLTYVASDGSWQGRISSNQSEDITLIFKANSKSYLCLNSTTTIKFRPAFHYTFHFYKGTNVTTDVTVKPYKNEFQYVYLRMVNTSSLYVDSTIFRDMTYVDRMFKWVPWYEPSFTAKADNEITFWAKYTSGEARIKLYEQPQNYSIYLMTDDTYGLTWSDEFTKPRLQDYSWTSKIIDKFVVTEAGDKTIGIYLSRWEVQKFLFLMNIGYWLLVFVVWGLLMMVISQHSWKASIGFTIGYFTFMKMIGLVIF